MPETVEQPVKQHDPVPQEDVETTLRRSTRARKSVISSDYIMYLQECKYHVGAENNPEIYC